MPGTTTPRYSYAAIASVLVAFFCTACASVSVAGPPQPQAVMAETKHAATGWWNAAFIIRWPEGTEPAWHLDLLLAHRIVAPVLYRHRDEIVLWRFHRRAARDEAGHQFSFSFYSPRDTAERIYAALKSDAHLKALKDSGLVMEDRYEDTTTIAKPDVQDMCDAAWSPPIKASWPYFAMGASEMWLRLVTQVADQTQKDQAPTSPEDMAAFYAAVNESVTELWRTEGSHAFLHHLNGLFGYEPLIIYEKRLIGF